MMTYEEALEERERILKTEPLGSGTIRLSKEEHEKINREHPLPSEEDIQRMLKEAGVI